MKLNQASYKHVETMSVARIIAKICCVALNLGMFAALIGSLVTGAEGDLIGVIQLIILGIVIFLTRLRLGHFLDETQGKTYQYGGIFARYYKGYYIDVLTLNVTFLIVVISGILYAYVEWWME